MPRESDFIPERKLKDEYEDDSDNSEEFSDKEDNEDIDNDDITIDA